MPRAKKVFPPAILSMRAIASSPLPYDNSNVNYENKKASMSLRKPSGLQGTLRKQIICL
jgi:hypothetical protein